MISFRNTMKLDSEKNILKIEKSKTLIIQFSTIAAFYFLIGYLCSNQANTCHKQLCSCFCHTPFLNCVIFETLTSLSELSLFGHQNENLGITQILKKV